MLVLQLLSALFPSDNLDDAELEIGDGTQRAARALTLTTQPHVSAEARAQAKAYCCCWLPSLPVVWNFVWSPNAGGHQYLSLAV